MTFLEPSRVIDKLDIRPGMKVADFGCGAGHFTVEMAKVVGNDGVVYAFDVQKEVLEALKSRIKLTRLLNIEISQVDLESLRGTKLADAQVDFILIANVLFQAENKKVLVEEAFRILKSEGKTAVIEWSDGDGNNLGPLKEMRFSKEKAREIFQSAGFKFEREFDAGASHYGLIFRK